MNRDASLLALDIGKKRVGVARANIEAGLAEPLKIINNNAELLEQLNQIISDEQAVILVVGLPRGLEGQETEQTGYTKTLIEQLKPNIDIPIVFEDEAMSSLEAKSDNNSKQAIDDRAAAIILQRYIDNNHDNYEEK